MPLLSFWKSNPESVLGMNIEQIVSTSGDGQLKDNTLCSNELRTFFGQVPRAKLAEYAAHCLSNSFPKSGFVLQDIVNEFGRRLGYQVTHGLYQGTSKAVGNDGLWSLADRHLLVEVKTTDAYRVPLDKIASYRDELLNKGLISKNNSMLVVVGRDDTGELEAQVRGSRHAWDLRLISVDALIRLVTILEQTESVETADKIRSLLVPIEYTRLDSLIDVMFSTAQDVVETVDSVLVDELNPGKSSEANGVTDKATLDAQRDRVSRSFGVISNKKVIKKSRVLYWDDTHEFRIACAISKRYEDASAPYWYAYHPPWDEFIAGSSEGYFLLGCMDLNIAFAIPYKVMAARKEELSTSTRPNGQKYYHIKILEAADGGYLLQMHKSGKHLPLKEYEFQLL